MHAECCSRNCILRLAFFHSLKKYSRNNGKRFQPYIALRCACTVIVDFVSKKLQRTENFQMLKIESSLPS